MPARPPILILQPDRARPPAALADLLARHGHATLGWLARSPQELPPTALRQRCGAIVVLDSGFPGPPGAATLDWLRDAHRAGHAVLGLGRGGEWLTLAHGGQVESGVTVRGWFALGLHPQAAATPWFERLGTRLPAGFLWQDGCWRAPPQARALLRCAADPCTAWAAPGLLAVRPHLELNSALYARWLAAWRSQAEFCHVDWQDTATLAAQAGAVAAQRALGERLVTAWLARTA